MIRKTLIFTLLIWSFHSAGPFRYSFEQAGLLVDTLFRFLVRDFLARWHALIVPFGSLLGCFFDVTGHVGMLDHIPLAQEYVGGSFDIIPRLALSHSLFSIFLCTGSSTLSSTSACSLHSFGTFPASQLVSFDFIGHVGMHRPLLQLLPFDTRAGFLGWTRHVGMSTITPVKAIFFSSRLLFILHILLAARWH